MTKPLLTIGAKEINKDRIIELMGDLTWLGGILILHANKYDEKETHKDKMIFSKIMSSLSKEIGLSADDVIAITTFANNKLNNTLDMSSKDEEE